MINIYEQVQRNKIKSTLIITLFISFIFIASYTIIRGFGLGDEYLYIAFGFSLFSSFASFFWGDKMVLALNKAVPANKKDYFDFYTTTENLCIGASLPLPAIYVINSPAMNAFAAGRDPKHAVVCATTGLLEKLDRTELEAVVAHELSHIQNYDIRLMTVVSILIGTLSLLTNLISHRSLRDNDDDSKASTIFMLIGIVMIIFAPLIAQLIQLAISRRREYLADASAVKLTRQPSGMINALKKLSSDDTPFKTASTATESMYIINPFKGKKLASLFSTHPPIEDRIKALEAMY